MPIHQLHNSVGGYNYNAFVYENMDWDYHFHGNFELLYVIDGCFELKVDDGAATLSKGQFALILPNQLHSFHIPIGSHVWVGVFSEEYVFRFASHMRGLVGEAFEFYCDPMTEAFFKYHVVENKSEDIYMLKSVFYAVCQQYLQHVQLRPRDAKGDNLFVRITDYVNVHFKEPVTLQEMAQTLGFEYHYLSRRFHEIFGMNFRRFLNQYRINHANELLQQNPHVCIAEIAYACGFKSVRNFNAVYKELNGCTPRAGKID